MSAIDAAQGGSSRSQLNRFLVGAALGLVGLFIVFRLPVVQEYVFFPWAAFLAQAAVSTLYFLGQEVTASHGVIHGAKLSLHVSEQCSGLEVIGVYVALTALYPSPWRWRIEGMLWGVALFQLLNFVRIIGFFWLDDSPWFDLFHSYVWPFVLVGAGCMSWLGWATWAHSSTRETSEATPPRISLRRALFFTGAVGSLMLVRSFLINSPPAQLFAAIDALEHAPPNVPAYTISALVGSITSALITPPSGPSGVHWLIPPRASPLSIQHHTQIPSSTSHGCLPTVRLSIRLSPFSSAFSRARPCPFP